MPPVLKLTPMEPGSIWAAYHRVAHLEDRHGHLLEVLLVAPFLAALLLAVDRNRDRNR